MALHVNTAVQLSSGHILSSRAYHAHMAGGTANAQSWVNGEVDIICGTSAILIGIDRPDVRLGIHLGLPAGLTQYVQERGRLSRDGRGGASTVMLKRTKGGRGLLAGVAADDLQAYPIGLRSDGACVNGYFSSGECSA
jgi:hypothetical protein